MSREITPSWLESLGFVPDARRPFAYLLWLADDARPHVQSYLQLLDPVHEGAWTAELVNVVEDDWVSAAIPRPILTRGNVLFLLTAIGGRLLATAEIEKI